MLIGCASHADIIDPTHKPAADAMPFVIDLYAYLVHEWSPNTEYSLGQMVRPFPGIGFALRATVAGTSAATPPPWRGPGAIRDGSVVWEMITAGSNGLSVASSVSVVVDPVGGLHVDALGIADGRYITGQYKDGEPGTDYSVQFSFSASGVLRSFAQQVRVT